MQGEPAAAAPSQGSHNRLLKTLAADVESIARIARGAFGIEERIGGPFECVQHRACAAYFAPTTSGDWLYHCDLEPQGLTLGKLRALTAGRTSTLGPVEHATWTLRAAVEADVLVPFDIDAAPPTPELLTLCGRNATYVETVWDGFLLLIRCR